MQYERNEAPSGVGIQYQVMETISIPVVLLTGVAAVGFFGSLFDHICDNDAVDKQFISTEIAKCLDNNAFNYIPWLLVVCIGIQLYTLLYICRKLNVLYMMGVHWPDVSLHILIFHLFFMLASVVEFRNDKNNTSTLKIFDLTESSLHIYAAGWVFSEIAFVHVFVVVTIHKIVRDNTKNVFYLLQYAYFIFIASYALMVILFIVFYFAEYSAIGVEWWLVVHSILLQICAHLSFYVIQQWLPHEIRSREKPSKHAETFWFLLVACVILNIIGIILVAPPWFLRSFLQMKDSEMETTLPFWLLTLIAFCVTIYDWKLWVDSEHNYYRPMIDQQDL